MKPSSEDGLSMDLNHGKRKKKENKYLSDHEGFNFSSMGNMWANAEIDHRTTAVYSGGGAIGNFGFDEVFLVFIVLHQSMRMKSWYEKRRTYIKHLKQLFLRYHKSLELLLFLDRTLGHLFESWIVGVRDWPELQGKL